MYTVHCTGNIIWICITNSGKMTIAFFKKEIIPQNKTKPQHSGVAGATEGLLLMFRFLLAISSSGANT